MAVILDNDKIKSIHAIEQGDDFDLNSTATAITVSMYNKMVPGLGDKYKKSLAMAKQEKTETQKKAEEEEAEKKRDALISVLFPRGVCEDLGIKQLASILEASAGLFEAIVAGVQCYSYSGFDPKKMVVQLAACQQHSGAFVRDMATLIAIFFLRGTNVGKMMLKTDASASEKAEFDRIINLYNVKARATKNEDVTLSRLTIIFPAMSYRIRQCSTNYNMVVKGSDLGLEGNRYQLYTYNFALYSISANYSDGDDLKKMLMYVCYQSALAKKISKSKTFSSKHLSDSAKYAIIGVQQRFDLLGSMTGKTVPNIENTDVLKALVYILNNGSAGLTFDEEFGYYTRAFNQISRERATKKVSERSAVTVDQLSAAMLEMS